MDAIHPARTLSFDDLITGLYAGRAAGAVARRYDASTRLALWVYTNKCVYDDLWDTFSRAARGLILDEDGRKVVATPFPKFFNAGERHGTIPDLPFEAFQKVDGSLIIIYHHGGTWRTATKGAFDSPQAQWAQHILDATDTAALDVGTTYLAEAVYPENRIVVRYDETGLVLLAAYAEDGREVAYAGLAAVGSAVGWRLARRRPFASIADMVAHSATLPRNDEGFVVRFEDGTRLKIKGAEYRRIHALISRCTPLAMWEAMVAGDDMSGIRRDLPEEFWADYDRITDLLAAEINEIRAKVEALASDTAHLSDKEVGLALKTMEPVAAPYLFPYRKGGFTPKLSTTIPQIGPTDRE